jgi:hypothetical protein
MKQEIKPPHASAPSRLTGGGRPAGRPRVQIADLYGVSIDPDVSEDLLAYPARNRSSAPAAPAAPAAPTPEIPRSGSPSAAVAAPHRSSVSPGPDPPSAADQSGRMGAAGWEPPAGAGAAAVEEAARRAAVRASGRWGPEDAQRRAERVCMGLESHSRHEVRARAGAEAGRLRQAS